LTHRSQFEVGWKSRAIADALTCSAHVRLQADIVTQAWDNAPRNPCYTPTPLPLAREGLLSVVCLNTFVYLLRIVAPEIHEESVIPAGRAARHNLQEKRLYFLFILKIKQCRSCNWVSIQIKKAVKRKTLADNNRFLPVSLVLCRKKPWNITLLPSLTAVKIFTAINQFIGQKKSAFPRIVQTGSDACNGAVEKSPVDDFAVLFIPTRQLPDQAFHAIVLRY
jgi:hypothetical protein